MAEFFAMEKSFAKSDRGAVLAGPLVALARGWKPSVKGLADPEGFFVNKPKRSEDEERQRRMKLASMSPARSLMEQSGDELFGG